VQFPIILHLRKFFHQTSKQKTLALSETKGKKFGKTNAPGKTFVNPSVFLPWVPFGCFGRSKN